MTRSIPLFLLPLAATLLLCSTACTPTEAVRGNIVEDFRIDELTPGVSTKTNVMRSLGSPTTKAPFDDNTWYYLGQKTEKHGIFDPEVVDEKILKVTFNEEGILQSVSREDNGRVDVPISRDETWTGGNDRSVLQQLLGNVGRFNRPDAGATDTTR